MNHPEDELLDITQLCIKELETSETLSLKTLLRVVDTNCNACETTHARAVIEEGELRKLFSMARREMRGAMIAACSADDSWELFQDPQEPGLWSELLQSLGVTGNPESNCTPGVAGTGQQSQGVDLHGNFGKSNSECDASALRIDLDTALDSIDRGPWQSLCDTSVLLGLFKDLRRRAEALQSSWPTLRRNMNEAFDAQKPLAITNIVLALKEALAWRRDTSEALARADVVDGRLWDALEHFRSAEQERLQLIQARQTLIKGMGTPNASARAAAVLWLGARARGRDGALQDLAGALRWNLRVCDDLDLQLRSCASAVMLMEIDQRIAKNAVAKLNLMKNEISKAAKQAISASGISPNMLCQGHANYSGPGHEEKDYHALFASALRKDSQSIDKALRELADVVDYVTNALRECPLSAQSLHKHVSVDEAVTFRNWISDSLLEKSIGKRNVGF